MPGRKKKVRSDDCQKRFTVYKCTNEDCRKSWNSFHGWQIISSYEDQCQIKKCGGNGRPINVEEEMAELDLYICSHCNERWWCLNSQPNQRRLVCKNSCGLAFITLSGTQTRHCKKVTFKCGKKGCGNQWISPFLGKEYSQKCRKCNWNGQIIGTEMIQPENDNDKSPKPATRRYWGAGAGGHNVEGCDMCQELRFWGLTCTSRNRVVIEEFMDPDGKITPVLQAVFSRRPAGSTRRPAQ